MVWYCPSKRSRTTRRTPNGWLLPRRVNNNVEKWVKVVSTFPQSYIRLTPLSPNNSVVLHVDGKKAPSRRMSEARVAAHAAEESESESGAKLNTY